MHILMDIGGTTTRIAATQNLNGFNEPIMLPTPKKYAEALSMFSEYIPKLCSNRALIESVTLGVPGVLNEKKTKLLKSPNLPEWEQKPLYKDLMMLTGKEPLIQNDAALGGLGEAHFGASKEAHISTYLNLGTGVGGVRIVNREIDAHTFGMEPGHMLLDNNSDIESNYKEALTKNDTNKLNNTLAILLINTTLLWSPELIVLNGGNTKNQHFSLGEISKIFMDNLALLPQKPRITLSVLGETAGLFGAMIYASQNK